MQLTQQTLQLIQQTLQWTQNTQIINSHFTDIRRKSLSIARNTGHITTNRNEIAALKASSSTTPTFTLTRGIKKGKVARKAGGGTTNGNNNIVTTVVVPKTGKFLVSFRVIIQPTIIEYANFNTKNWYGEYYPRANRKLKTWLYIGTRYYDTQMLTDCDLYNKSFPHHIFSQKVLDLTKGDNLNLKSWCDEFDDDYTLLHFYAYDAEITLLSL